jgi:serine/threonine protein kinase
LRAMLKPGTIIGGSYRLLSPLAQGGMAEIYTAELCFAPQNDNRIFAIKRLLPNLGKLKLFSYLFEKEASLSIILHHPNIVRCHELIKEGGDLFMVMEFIFGQEIAFVAKKIQHLGLFDRIKIAVAIGIGAAKALSYFHAKTDALGDKLFLVHGDISPQNIMVNKDGVVKLYDFGAFHSALYDDKIIKGNFSYMAPEQVFGKKIDARTDIYSLCLVLMELIFLDRSFFKSNDESLFHKAIKQSLGFNQALESFFKKGLSYDPGQRFESSAEMLDHLISLSDSFNLLSPEIFLQKVLWSNKFNKPSNKAKHQESELISLAYFSLLMIGIFAGLVFALSIFSKAFESKQYFNIPYWSESDGNKI